jgi:hypothetical protein
MENGTQTKQQPEVKDTKEGDDDSTFSTAADLQNKETLSKLLEEDRHIPTKHVQVLTLTFGVIIFINLMKGGGAFPSPLGIRCGSPSFWISNAVLASESELASDESGGSSYSTSDFGDFGAMYIRPSSAKKLSPFISTLAVVLLVAGLGLVPIG